VPTGNRSTSLPIVQAEEVAKRWGSTQALAGATFEIGEGVTGLLGPNGAGKTTLIGLILGLHRPDGGRVRVLGMDPWEAGAEVRARLGYAPEHEALPPDVAAHDVVRHLAELHGIPRREATSRASDALWEVGLGEERFRPVGTMSTGQRQRVKLAAALGHDPELLLLDEPTSGLDPGQREDMLGLIHHVGADLGMNVVMASHLLEEVERVSQSVVILDAGRAVASGRLEDLLQTEPQIVVELAGPDGAGPAETGPAETGPAGALAAALGARGLRADAESPWRVVVRLEGDCDETAAFDVVRDVLADGGFALRRLQRRAESLADVYLARAGQHEGDPR
jgi:ABC-2 type transport system ATP-binding protein